MLVADTGEEISHCFFLSVAWWTVLAAFPHFDNLVDTSSDYVRSSLVKVCKEEGEREREREGRREGGRKSDGQKAGGAMTLRNTNC